MLYCVCFQTSKWKIFLKIHNSGQKYLLETKLRDTPVFFPYQHITKYLMNCWGINALNKHIIIQCNIKTKLGKRKLIIFTKNEWKRQIYYQPASSYTKQNTFHDLIKTKMEKVMILWINKYIVYFQLWGQIKTLRLSNISSFSFVFLVTCICLIWNMKSEIERKSND